MEKVIVDRIVNGCLIVEMVGNITKMLETLKGEFSGTCGLH
jgi:hypothetical protein